MSCAENDHAFDAEARKKAFEVLQREGKRYHVQLFYGASHGFAVKGDPEDPYQSRFPIRMFMEAMTMHSANTMCRMVQGAKLASHDRLVHSVAGGTVDVVSRSGPVPELVHARLKSATSLSKHCTECCANCH